MVPKLERSGDNVQDVEGKPLDEWILQKLQAKAESNFLYARLMVEWLKEDVFTIDDVITFIKSRVPNNIAEMYKRIFRQYQEDQHRYIRSQLFLNSSKTDADQETVSCFPWSPSLVALCAYMSFERQ
ncbi:hypothetical protein K4K53_011858 [Colletotrichum sp. SAR 10_77]|nr:hypothetical protein K4K52_012937 [Colletotrichum sp. SAR 10_76]KAI8251774.1 hypothetical protein K4K53_011858 [Colletotrichum sp. SAR 10_77]